MKLSTFLNLSTIILVLTFLHSVLSYKMRDTTFNKNREKLRKAEYANDDFDTDKLTYEELLDAEEEDD
jgi:hypothetical protein